MMAFQWVGLQASLNRESNKRTGASDEQIINSAKRWAALTPACLALPPLHTATATALPFSQLPYAPSSTSYLHPLLMH